MLFAMVAAGDRPVAVALRPPDLVATGKRLGLDVVEAERVGTDGRSVHWRMAGLERAFGPERLPFFIDWRAAGPFDSVARGVGDASGFAWVQLTGVRDTLTAWIGEEPDWLRFEPGQPGIPRFAISRPHEELVVG